MSGYWLIAIVIAIAVGALGLWIHERTERRKRAAAYLVRHGFKQSDAEWIVDENPEQANNGLAWINKLIEHGDYETLYDAGVFAFRGRNSFGLHATLYQFRQHQLPLPNAASRKEFFAIVECARRVLSCRGRNTDWPQWHDERPTSAE